MMTDWHQSCAPFRGYGAFVFACALRSVRKGVFILSCDTNSTVYRRHLPAPASSTQETFSVFPSRSACVKVVGGPSQIQVVVANPHVNGRLVNIGQRQQSPCRKSGQRKTENGGNRQRDDGMRQRHLRARVMLAEHRKPFSLHGPKGSKGEWPGLGRMEVKIHGGANGGSYELHTKDYSCRF
ncbi:uncharacterized protein UV8b_04059 [Ustilaginoidea virens]|uniref:Uncharacterized protein n=1 Tax=Ustilaginoidea virens TaxID=1159556 RepID=A0A8E5MGS4_USTVR|nr:uncharacterized protein UV8b_04059 [Ustilaginoidea virens]QUC19818.1 hypothetical protein UV8b_04059 [Ustilaginoidea virens]